MRLTNSFILPGMKSKVKAYNDLIRKHFNFEGEKGSGSCSPQAEEMSGKTKDSKTIKAMMGYLGELEEQMDEDDVELLAKVFRSQTFKALLKVEQSVEKAQHVGPSPCSENAFLEAKQLYLQLKRRRKHVSLITALIDVLEDPHIQALLATHDLIAKEKLIKGKADVDEEFIDRIKKVKINKDDGETLGATIKRHELTDRIVIARILHGGAAQRTGLLHQGDEILEVNGIEIDGVSLDGVASLLGLDTRTVELKIVAAEESNGAEEEYEKIFMRAHFSYNPSEDPHIPCKDAGLNFTKGDILEIIDINEPRWWQARKFGTKDKRTGIIPSRQTQEKRLALKLWSPNNSFSGEELDASMSKSLSPRDQSLKNASRSISPTNKGKKKKSKKVKYQPAKDIHSEEIMIYEEVTQIMADFDRPRPILITGVTELGCDDLRRSLVEIDKGKFKSPVYHTTHPKKHRENADENCRYVSRAEMEKGIRCGTFINAEVSKHHISATRVDSIKEIVDGGKACVMFVNPECLPVICGADLHPFVVFIKAPDIDLLAGYLSARQDQYLFETRHLTEEELYKVAVGSEEIENNYGHYFDLVLTITDMETTLNQLYHAVCKMVTEPLWIPVR